MQGDYINDEAIARQCGICRRTLAYWKKQPSFERLRRNAASRWYLANGYNADGSLPPDFYPKRWGW